MNIDEAIELQRLLCESSILDPLPRYKDAIKLGIEALKREKYVRETYQKPSYALLPGETKE